MSRLPSRALITTIGASVWGRARWMNEKPSMPPSIRSTNIKSTS